MPQWLPCGLSDTTTFPLIQQTTRHSGLKLINQLFPLQFSVFFRIFLLSIQRNVCAHSKSAYLVQRLMSICFFFLSFSCLIELKSSTELFTYIFNLHFANTISNLQSF